jgi:hypothetical protein
VGKVVYILRDDTLVAGQIYLFGVAPVKAGKEAVVESFV